MRIGLTYDLQDNSRDERQAEFDPPATLEALCQALEVLGHQTLRLGNAFDLPAGAQRLGDVDLVFNLAEGSHGRCREAWVPTLLELFKVPYVGSDPLALSVGLDKAASKRLAAACGIPTPRWIAVRAPEEIPANFTSAFPVILKPRYEGSGIGVDEGAVVRGPAAVRERAEWLFKRWPEPILIEEFIPHGELTVCVIGNDPPTAYPAIQRPLDPDTRLSCHVVKNRSSSIAQRWETPLVLTPELDAQARRIALTMFEALGCCDMARVDLRVDAAGRAWFLEINPLPSFDPEGSFGLLAECLGVSYAQLIERIVEAARVRLMSSKSIVSAFVQ